MYNNYDCIRANDYNLVGMDPWDDEFVNQVLDPFVYVAFSTSITTRFYPSYCHFLIMTVPGVSFNGYEHLAYHADSPYPGVMFNGRKRGVVCSIPELVTKQSNKLSSVLSFMDTS